MKKVKVKKNKKVKIVKNGKVVFEKTTGKNLLIETNDEVIIS